MCVQCDVQPLCLGCPQAEVRREMQTAENGERGEENMGKKEKKMPEQTEVSGAMQEELTMDKRQRGECVCGKTVIWKERNDSQLPKKKVCKVVEKMERWS